MQLFYQQYPEDSSQVNSDHSPIIIIPGLFGSTVNWRGFARNLSKEYLVYVVDQRNHGESPHADSHSYADMVADLLQLVDDLGLERVTLCGHSMGGKVAMAFSLLYPDRVDKLAVLDIAPVAYTHSHAPYIKALMAIDLSQLASRSDAEKALQESIPDMATRLFLMQSLVGSPGNYRWRLNLAILYQYMSDITSFPEQDLVGMSSDLKPLFLTGSNSDYVLEQHNDAIKYYFPKAVFNEIEGAGHWLHAEQPKRVLEALTVFLKNEK